MIGSKFSRHFFNQSQVKPKPIVAHTCTFSRTLCQLRVITSSFDWFAGLSQSFLIGQSNYFGFGFTTLNWNSLYPLDKSVGFASVYPLESVPPFEQPRSGWHIYDNWWPNGEYRSWASWPQPIITSEKQISQYMNIYNANILKRNVNNSFQTSTMMNLKSHQILGKFLLTIHNHTKVFEQKKENQQLMTQ